MGQVFEIQFPVLITIDGCVNVTISAEAIIYRDTEYVTICNKVPAVVLCYPTKHYVLKSFTGRNIGEIDPYLI